MSLEPMALHDVSVPIREGMSIHHADHGFEIRFERAITGGAG